jgi:hypothetical protein
MVCPVSGAWCVVGMDGARAPLALGNGSGRTQANVEVERRRPLAGIPQTIYRTRKAVPSVALPRQLQVAERNFHCGFGSRVLWGAGMFVRWMLDAWMLGCLDARMPRAGMVAGFAGVVAGMVAGCRGWYCFCAKPIAPSSIGSSHADS